MKSLKQSLALAALLAAAGPLLASTQRGPGGQRSGPVGPLEVHEAPTAPGIAWFGTWAEAQAEAERTGRPILFMSAAPQCQNVPGVW